MENIKESVHNDFVQLRKNKKEHFDTFYKNNYDLVYKICFSLLKEIHTSEDITQNIFVKLLKMDESQMPTEYESSWLYTVTKNEVLQYFRKKKETDGEEAMENIQNNDHGIDNVIEDDNYKNIMKKLNKKQEQIVSLKVVSDFTFKEIGQIMSMPTATVQWYYYSSIKYLKVAMANFAMFLIALVTGAYYIKRNEEESIQFEGTNKEIEDRSEEPASEQSAVQNDSTNKSNMASHEQRDVMQVMESTQAQEPLQKNINGAYVGIISVTAIFLILSIIFSIFFIKYQQKVNKKASKK